VGLSALLEPGSNELPWPVPGLDLDRLLCGGWEPLAFTEFVVKVHSRCNLACDYCYIYEMADQGWRNQPKVMGRKVFDETCATIADHARRHGVTRLNLVLHGGEPLLAGHQKFEYFARRARELLEPATQLKLGVQTNGTLLDDEFLGICDRWNVRIGVSVDGDQRGHDRHRPDRRGRGSYAWVAAALEQLASARWRHLFSGLLCTIDLANDPLETFDALLRFDPPAVDFLLPHGNWTTPPPGRPPDQNVAGYADWLIPVFDRWYIGDSDHTRVRLFDNILELLLGGNPASECVGLAPIRLVVIETDGSLELVDELKSAYSGAARLQDAVGSDNPFDRAMVDPGVVARQIGAAALSDACHACPIHTVCGGGHYVHRYRADNGFRNPSVYCADLKKLIRHVESRLRADLDAAARRRNPITD
jgi:uncharacterized protein